MFNKHFLVSLSLTLLLTKQMASYLRLVKDIDFIGLTSSIKPG